jgi:hypothetical protein
MSSCDSDALSGFREKETLEKEIRKKTIQLVVDVIDFVLSLVIGVTLFFALKYHYGWTMAWAWVILYIHVNHVVWKLRRLPRYRMGESEVRPITRVRGCPIEIDPKD